MLKASEKSGAFCIIIFQRGGDLNNENLIPAAHKLTVEEQSRGGKSSAVSRSFRSATKRRLREHPEFFEETITMLTDKTLSGDLKALELLLELSGESPKQMEIAIKKRELKLKEQAMQSGVPGEAELPALFKALEADDI